MKMQPRTDLQIHTNDNALLAYIDLLGTKSLYTGEVECLRSQAENLFRACIYRFFEVFKNSFTQEEIRNNFYINVYADSIMICEREKIEGNVERLVEFLLKYQVELISRGYEATTIERKAENKAILSRAIIGQGSYFSIHTGSDLKSFFGSDLIEVSICGGKALVDLDKVIKGLPLGVYVYNDLIRSEIDLERRISVQREKFSFIKQKKDLLELSMIPYFDSCGSTMFEHCVSRLTHLKDNARGKSGQWIAAHKGELKIIKKSN